MPIESYSFTMREHCSSIYVHRTSYIHTLHRHWAIGVFFEWGIQARNNNLLLAHHPFYGTRLIELNWTVCDLYVGCCTHFNAYTLLMKSLSSIQISILRGYFGYIGVRVQHSGWIECICNKRFEFFALLICFSTEKKENKTHPKLNKVNWKKWNRINTSLPRIIYTQWESGRLAFVSINLGNILHIMA